MHWRNSKFQVAHFLVGKCHTPDEAYRILCELMEERQLAFNNVRATDLRTQAKLIRATNIISGHTSYAEKLEAEADIAEIDAFRVSSQACIDEAQRELQFINQMIIKLQPYRKFKHLPDYEAHQLCQQEEWKLEMLWRAQNYISSHGAIPAEQLSTMRLHPEWNSAIAPAIQSLVQAVKSGNPVALARPMDTILLELVTD